MGGSYRKTLQKERIAWDSRLRRRNAFITEGNAVNAMKEKEKRHAKELQNVMPVFDFFRESYAEVLDNETIERIISSFICPPAKYSAIVRIARMLDEIGIDSEGWKEKAMELFLK